MKKILIPAIIIFSLSVSAQSNSQLKRDKIKLMRDYAKLQDKLIESQDVLIMYATKINSLSRDVRYCNSEQAEIKEYNKWLIKQNDSLKALIK